jgi:hypothetical protein
MNGNCTREHDFLYVHWNDSFKTGRNPKLFYFNSKLIVETHHISKHEKFDLPYFPVCNCMGHGRAESPSQS